MKKFKFKKKENENLNSWEKGFGKLMTPFEEFIKGEVNSGVLLIICTFIALFFANSSFYDAYHHFLSGKVSLSISGFKLEMSIHHFINDGLMTLFFFLVGLEIKREVLVGELSVLRQALLPICAAVGGMVIPALIYHAFNANGASEAGWGIPMATDIAFAVTALVILGKRIPKSLMTFLIALAIVDDLGAVLVIAVFYTTNIDIQMLMLAFVIFAGLLLMNLVGVRSTIPYAILGIILWLVIYKSGIHATVAGILTAMTIPARSKYNPKEFVKGARKLIDKFDFFREKESNILKATELNSVLQTLETGINRAQTPLQNLEHAQHLPVNFLIIPIFALANAGIPIDLGSLGDTLTDNTVLGVILGLVIGKPLGIFISCFLAIKFKLCSLPQGVSMQQILGAGILAGIGFTMSIFVSELAFRGSEANLVYAKTAILFASLLAFIIGFTYLYILGNKQDNSLQNLQD